MRHHAGHHGNDEHDDLRRQRHEIRQRRPGAQPDQAPADAEHASPRPAAVDVARVGHRCAAARQGCSRAARKRIAGRRDRERRCHHERQVGSQRPKHVEEAEDFLRAASCRRSTTPARRRSRRRSWRRPPHAQPPNPCRMIATTHDAVAMKMRSLRSSAPTAARCRKRRGPTCSRRRAARRIRPAGRRHDQSPASRHVRHRHRIAGEPARQRRRDQPGDERDPPGPVAALERQQPGKNATDAGDPAGQHHQQDRRRADQGAADQGRYRIEWQHWLSPAIFICRARRYLVHAIYRSTTTLGHSAAGALDRPFISASMQRELPERPCHGFHPDARDRGHPRAHARFIEEHVLPLESDPENFSEHENIPTERLEPVRAKAKAAGLWAPQSPKEYGGMGLPIVAWAVMYEEAARSIFGPLALNCMAPDDGNMNVLAKRRHAGAEGQVAAPDRRGQGALDLRDDRAGAGRRLRPEHDPYPRREEGRPLGHQRPQVVHHRRRRRRAFHPGRAHLGRQAARA